MHYGVKGMKWGVRKQYVSKGRQGVAPQSSVQASTGQGTPKERASSGKAAAEKIVNVENTSSNETESRQKKLREEISKSDWSQGEQLVRSNLDDDDIETINRFLDRADKAKTSDELRGIYSESIDAFMDIAEKMLGKDADDLIDFAIESMMDTSDTWYRSERNKRAAMSSSVSYAQQHSMQVQQQIMNDQFQRDTMQASINAANQAASLAMTQGMNPFMFG